LSIGVVGGVRVASHPGTLLDTTCTVSVADALRVHAPLWQVPVGEEVFPQSLGAPHETGACGAAYTAAVIVAVPVLDPAWMETVSRSEWSATVAVGGAGAMLASLVVNSTSLGAQVSGSTVSLIGADGQSV
jgi:hypothetical protein